jgi:Uma2 family endonuclease
VSFGSEYWDGNVVVRPRETPRHEQCVSALAAALRVGLTDLHVVSGVALRLGPGRIVLPDLVVAGSIDLDDPVVDADAVRLVCEVVSPASAVLDRVLKMHGYAAAGIPCYLVAEPDRGALHSHELRGATYVTGTVMQLVQVTGVDFGPQ